MRWERKIFVLLASVILISGCAKRVAPSGGPADTTPPEIVSSEPSNGSSNFPTDGEITVKFSEPVKPNPDAVVIFPPAKISVDFHKSKVIVRPPEGGFAENTTYTLIFTTEFSDRHGNKLSEPAVIAFSTGEMVDTAKIVGRVIDGVQFKPVEGVLVAAFEDSLHRGTPVRITFSGENGRFVLQNLAADEKYYLFALEGVGSRVDFDHAEKISAPADPVDGGDTTIPALVLIPRDTVAPAVLDVTPYGTRTVEIKLSEPIDLRRLVSESLTPWFAPADSRIVFVRFEGTPRKIPLNLCDQWGNCADTTIPLPDSFPPDTTPPTAVFRRGKTALLPPVDRFKLPFSEPFVGGKFEIIASGRKLEFSRQMTAPNVVEFVLAEPFQPADSVAVVYDSICDEFANCAAGTVSFSVENQKPGRVEVSIDGGCALPAESPVVFLRSGGKNFVLKKDNGDFSAYVPTGKYALFLLCDRDGDRRWTPGTLAPFTPSENLWIYPDSVSVRAGWKTQVNWRIPQ